MKEEKKSLYVYSDPPKTSYTFTALCTPCMWQYKALTYVRMSAVPFPQATHSASLQGVLPSEAAPGAAHGLLHTEAGIHSQCERQSSEREGERCYPVVQCMHSLLVVEICEI